MAGGISIVSLYEHGQRLSVKLQFHWRAKSLVAVTFPALFLGSKLRVMRLMIVVFSSTRARSSQSPFRCIHESSTRRQKPSIGDGVSSF